MSTMIRHLKKNYFIIRSFWDMTKNEYLLLLPTNDQIMLLQNFCKTFIDIWSSTQLTSTYFDDSSHKFILISAFLFFPGLLFGLICETKLHKYYIPTNLLYISSTPPTNFCYFCNLFATRLSCFPRIRMSWIQRALERFCCYIYFSKRMLYSFEKKLQNKLQ